MSDAAAQRESAEQFDLVLCEYDLEGGQDGQQLLEDLRHQMSDDEFNASLGGAIDEIYTGSTRKI